MPSAPAPGDLALMETTGAAPPRDFTVVALISAHNEADIIGPVLRALITEGVHAYLIDDASTDRTVAEAEPFLGRGLLAIERFTGAAPGEYNWAALLRRKEQLARELDADWFIHHDADEFRESVWSGMTLREAIRLVDRAGYNAIDFALLNFWPTHDGFRSGDDPRAAFPYYEPGQVFNRVQIRCWKKTAAGVDLAIEGGHDAMFEGRRVFPLRFLLRHYPIRTQAHAERKIFQERRPRFRAAERERRWHLQYEHLSPGASFIRDPATLTAYDPAMVRLQTQLSTRTVEELQARLGDMERRARQLRDQVHEALDELHHVQERERREGEDLQHAQDAIAHLSEILQKQAHKLQSQQQQLQSQQQQLQSQQQQLRAQQQVLEAVFSARTWRWMAPVRHVSHWVRRGWRCFSTGARQDPAGGL